MRSPDAASVRLSAQDFLARCGLLGPPGSAPCHYPCPPHLPLVDTRSPGEFRQGHIPGAVSLPLFSDAEREHVGTVYRQRGKESALLLGLGLTGPKMEALARRALDLAGSGMELALYCGRGGMRSASLAWLFTLAGIRVQVLDGGYKAFRRHVLELYQAFPGGPCRLFVLGGKTGSGKTEILRRMADAGAQVLDLEGLAHHRGSAFGALPNCPQPACEHFENLLATALSQCDAARPVWVEDESENLGLVNLPRAFFHRLRASPLILLDVPTPARLERVLAEYGDIAFEDMAGGMDRIRKRLGGLEHKRAHEALEKGDMRSVAEILLAYYDRAYEKQLRSRTPYKVIAAKRPEAVVRELLSLER